MTDYFYTLGDHQPNTGQIHLPPGDRQDICNEMKNDLGELSVGEMTFLRSKFRPKIDLENASFARHFMSH
jgi:hypothetical protein